MVQPVLFHRKQQGFLKFRFIDFPVVDGDLGAGTGIQRIEELGIIEEHRCLVLFPSDLIVNIGKGKGLGEPASYLKNPIRPDALDGDGVLYGLRDCEFLFL